MQFIFDGKYYKVIKISGPKHNMLGLAFDINQSSDNHIEISILGMNKDGRQTISSSDVKNQVGLGLQQANKQLNVNYKIKKIQFVATDTPSQQIYKELTLEILKRLASGGYFKKTD